MGKQFEFYSHKNDDEMIANTLRSIKEIYLLLTFVLMIGRCI